MTDDQSPDPLEPIPVTEPTATTPGAQHDPAHATTGPPTVEAPIAASADPAGGPMPATAPPPPSGPRRSVTVPLWALASVGGVLLLGLGFLLGWVLAPSDGDGGDVAGPFANSRQMPFGDEFNPFSPDGNGRPGDRWEGGGDRWEGDDAPGGTAYLGVVVRDSSDPDGAQVVRVAPSSPADDAGLAPGDVITAVDDDEVDDAAALTRRIRSQDPADEVTVEYQRDGEEVSAEIRLDERPSRLEIVPPTTRPRATS